jgi:hypothetical protein
MEKPIYVSGYVRNKKIQQNQVDSRRMALVLLSVFTILTLIVYWKITVTVALIISLAVFAKKYYQFVNDPGRLVVNYYGMSQVGNIVNNVKEMVWG